ncbi:nucleotide pyrophosphohydrolase [Portibacter marinus]|uniref:nucleotide pyrophosphohydrolase n=1 Tax=Portibacter marinus TaxID=2898660 RepID=UPI001F408E49|nr:nucleotide pyrophosphohydrolase [Portibacter marinus]
MQINEAQEKVHKWIEDYGIRYFNELTNMAMLTEEVGELARIVARTYGEQSFKVNPEKPAKEMLADEMADVMFVLICMANQMEIDLEAALLKNLKKKTDRDASRHEKNQKLKK